MHDIKFLSILASQVAVILGKEILLERLKIEKEKFRNLNVISKKLTMVFEVSKLNDVLEEELKSIFDYDIFALMVFKSDLSGANLFFGLNGEKAKYLIKDSYDMITNLLKIHIKNFDESAINIKGIDEFDLNMFSKNIGLKSHLIMPLIENDKILGIFFIGSSDSNAITVEDDIEIFSVIGNYVETTLRKIMLFKENERLAFSDPMTGIYNYRYFKKKLEEEFNRAKRYSKPLSIIIIDIDFFKFFNDNYGHQQGDLVLKEVADILKKKVRTVDTVARYGGEEFVIILYETDIKHAVKIAERIRKTVETTEFENRVNKGETLRITISVGVASLNDDVKSISDFIDYADACLYKAKNSGRNRVCYYDGEKYGQV
jgi:diguanylate cyclase (GGDEF)-like protein